MYFRSRIIFMAGHVSTNALAVLQTTKYGMLFFISPKLNVVA
jgi:hypothetical protein